MSWHTIGSFVWPFARGAALFFSWLSAPGEKWSCGSGLWSLFTVRGQPAGRDAIRFAWSRFRSDTSARLARQGPRPAAQYIGG
jgi:hypothetical protein